jgi:hypothetical protein
VARQSRRAKLFVLPLTTAISSAMLSCSSNPREWRTNADIKICVDDLDKRSPTGTAAILAINTIVGTTLMKVAMSLTLAIPCGAAPTSPLLRAAHTVLLQAAPMWQLLNPPEQAP